MDKKLSWLLNEVDQWVEKGIIDQSVADSIKGSYRSQESEGKDRIMMAFGIIGVILIGLGIITLFAFNWKYLNRPTRVIVSLIPLLIAQIFMVFSHTIGKSRIWTEVSAVATGFGLVAALSLTSQTYQFSGSFSGLMTLWMLLMLPVIYIMKSNYTAVLYLIASIIWASDRQFGYGSSTYEFWVFGILIIPFFVLQVRNKENQIAIRLMSLALCVWACVSLGIVLEKQVPGLWIICYAAMFWCFYEIGDRFMEGERLLHNPFKLFGLWGSLVVAFLLTFDWAWLNIGFGSLRGDFGFAGLTDFLVLATLFIPGLFFLVKVIIDKSYKQIILGSFPVLAAVCYLIASYNQNTMLVVTNVFNLYLLLLSIILIVYGNQNRRLAYASLGLLWIMVLALARFLDLDIDTIAKGIGFIIIGVMFLVANILIIRLFRKRGAEHEEA